MCFLTGCDLSMPTTCLVLAFHSIGPAGVNECNSWRPAAILRGVQVKQSRNRCCIPTSFINQFRLWAFLHSPDPYQDKSARSSRGHSRCGGNLAARSRAAARRFCRLQLSSASCWPCVVASSSVSHGESAWRRPSFSPDPKFSAPRLLRRTKRENRR